VYAATGKLVPAFSRVIHLAKQKIPPGPIIKENSTSGYRYELVDQRDVRDSKLRSAGRMTINFPQARFYDATFGVLHGVSFFLMRRRDESNRC
jgi:hypothetical protein